MVRVSTLQDEASLTIRRTYPVNRETLFAAWTDPEQIAKWFAPTPEHTIEVREYDFREGGKYALAFSKNGKPATDVVGGVFQKVVAPELVSYTWQWAEPTDHSGVETLVEVQFHEVSKHESELVLTHTKFNTAEMRDSHNQGWGGCLDSLATHLKKGITNHE